MSVVLDSGALIAVERGDRDLIALIKHERQADRVPVTHGGVVGQVWRGGVRQAQLARFLAAVDVEPLDDNLGRKAGVLLAQAGGADVIDAAVAIIAEDDDVIFTSDPSDLSNLVGSLGRHVGIVRT